MDGWGDHWMDGRVARRTGECGGKAGVGEWTRWVDGWIEGGWVGHLMDRCKWSVV